MSKKRKGNERNPGIGPKLGRQFPLGKEIGFVNAEEILQICLEERNSGPYIGFVEFLFTLPFALGLNNDKIVNWKSREQGFIFVLRMIEVPYPQFAGDDVVSRTFNGFHTAVNAIVMIREYVDAEIQPISHYFDASVEDLNAFLAAYAFRKSDHTVAPISNRSIQPMIKFRVHYFNKDKEDSESVLLLNVNFRGLPDQVSEEEFHKILEASYLISRGANREEYAIHRAKNDAIRSGYFGEYANCIVRSSAWIEALSYFLLAKSFRIDGMSESDLEDRLEGIHRAGFFNVIKDHMKRRFGGDWATDDPETDIGKWYDQCYSIRHKIVHRGYVPDVYEADASVGACLDLSKGILDRVRSGRSRYRSIADDFAIPLNLDDWTGSFHSKNSGI